MSYRIRERHTFSSDKSYVDSIGNSCYYGEAKSFRSEEDAKREMNSLTWHHNKFSSDWEVTDR